MTTTANAGITIAVPMTFTEKRLHDILAAAFEGGVGYWARIIGYRGDTSGVEYKHIEMPLRGAVLLIDSTGEGGIAGTEPGATGEWSCYEGCRVVSLDQLEREQDESRTRARSAVRDTLLAAARGSGDDAALEAAAALLNPASSLNCPKCGTEPSPVVALDRAALERGLALMSTEQPGHFADFVSGNEDAETGDVLLQLALLGEVVFG